MKSTLLAVLSALQRNSGYRPSARTMGHAVRAPQSALNESWTHDQLGTSLSPATGAEASLVQNTLVTSSSTAIRKPREVQRTGPGRQVTGPDQNGIVYHSICILSPFQGTSPLIILPTYCPRGWDKANVSSVLPVDQQMW